jgi:hypothetical protein
VTARATARKIAESVLNFADVSNGRNTVVFALYISERDIALGRLEQLSYDTVCMYIQCMMCAARQSSTSG